MGVFSRRKIPLIKEWIRLKEEEVDNPTFMYHEFEEPKGRIFKASEVQLLEKSGWVDSSAKFGKGFKSRTRRSINTAKIFWLAHWKWIIGTILAIVGLAIAWTKG